MVSRNDSLVAFFYGSKALYIQVLDKAAGALSSYARSECWLLTEFRQTWEAPVTHLQPLEEAEWPAVKTRGLALILADVGSCDKCHRGGTPSPCL